MAYWNDWDKRYKEIECAYGIDPNEFFKSQLSSLHPGYLLLPGEGEGRNAIWAAKNGWNVSAFDFSSEAVIKATKIFKSENLNVSYKHCSVENFKPEMKYDVVGLIYLHLPSVVRKLFFHKINNWLNPGGRIILECFHADQIVRFSGGPKDPDLFPSFNDLLTDFSELKIETLKKEEISLSEGQLHQGLAMVTRLVAIK